jgi:xanthine/uracil permease
MAKPTSTPEIIGTRRKMPLPNTATIRVVSSAGTGPDDFGLKGIALCAVVAIALNLLLPGNDGWKNKKPDEPLL